MRRTEFGRFAQNLELCFRKRPGISDSAIPHLPASSRLPSLQLIPPLNAEEFDFSRSIMNEQAHRAGAFRIAED